MISYDETSIKKNYKLSRELVSEIKMKKTCSFLMKISTRSIKDGRLNNTIRQNMNFFLFEV